MSTSLKSWLIVVLLLAGQTAGAEKAGLVEPRTALFYPDQFTPADTLPSLALVREPELTDALPEKWVLRPEFSVENGTNIACFHIPPSVSLYGMGEFLGPLRRNGSSTTLWNTDNMGYRQFGGRRLYQSHPWVLGVRADGSAFGILADSSWRMEFDLYKGLRISSDGPSFRVLVMERASPQDVMKALAEWTGAMPLPPLWSLGFQQCRWSYYPDARVREIADTFRAKNIPCDVIWMDIHYMDAYRVFTFSPEHFPEPRALNDYLHERGFKSVWMIDPGVKAEPGYAVYDSGTAADGWVQDSVGCVYTGQVWPGECVFPDFTRPDTRSWWAGLYADFIGRGVDGVWNDMNEPAVFKGPDGTMPIDNRHRGGGELPAGPHARYHNVYGMLMVRATREGVLAAQPDKRPFVLTRANFLGGHRYAATWTGDNIANWDHLIASIPMSLNLGLSGQPFNGADIGGFKDNSTPELFAHWMALGVFYPFSRAHKACWTTNQEPWMLGEEVEQVSRTAIERRYRLLPYLYTLFREASINGLPVMRPVFFAQPSNTALHREDQAFLLGADLLILPRWAENPTLPDGFTHALSLAGENPTNDLYQPEVRLRDGAMVPLGPIVQSTAGYPRDTLSFVMALDREGRATGTLYEDAGDGFGYRSGEYRLSTFVAERKNHQVVVRREKIEGHMDFGQRALQVELITATGTCKAVGKEDEPLVFDLPEK